MKYIYDDGGRSAAGYKGSCGDCVARAIAIATEQPYDKVYKALAEINSQYRGRRAKSAKAKSARHGIVTKSAAFKRYMESLGWVFVPTMTIGSGCTVHLADGELPMGRLIASVSRHYCAVIDGVIHDTHDPNDRGSTIYSANYPENEVPKNARKLANGCWSYAPKRCVYGYWKKS